MLDSKNFEQISGKALQMALKEHYFFVKYLTFYTDFLFCSMCSARTTVAITTAHCATLLLQNRIVVKPEVSHEKVVHWLCWIGS